MRPLPLPLRLLVAFVSIAAGLTVPLPAQPDYATPYYITTLAGSGATGADDGTGIAATFNFPNGVAIDGTGNVFVADSNNGRIRKVTPSGVVSTLPSPYLGQIRGIAVDNNGNIYIGGYSAQTIQKITSTGDLSTLAGQVATSGSVDATGAAARFSFPVGVAADGSGNVFVADWGSHTIRKVTAAGVVTTLAGLADNSGSTDGTGSAARFNRPWGIGLDNSGNLFVGDSSNHIVRKITPAGVVTTFAGSPGVNGTLDATGTAARLHSPSSIAVDSSNNIYVGSGASNSVRKITPARVVTTLAGVPGAPGSTDGLGEAAQFDGPLGIAVDAAGNLYVADANNDKIRRSQFPPIIVVPPQSTSRDIGGSVVLVVSATSDSHMTFQWRKNGTPISGGVGNYIYLSLNNVQLTDAAEYSVVVTNLAGSTTSSNATLTVVVPEGMPTLTTQPQDQTVTLGSPVQFSVTATPATGLTFQWRKNGTSIAGATAAIFTINSAQLANAGNYSVTVSNGVGSVTSNDATLIVNAPLATPPVISTHPASQTLSAGATLSLSVNVTGTQPLGFQWFKNGTAIPGATAILYSISNTQVADAASYLVVVTNSAGVATSNAAVVGIATPPTIATQPVSKAVVEGTNVEYAVSVSGTTPLLYQWRKDGVNLTGASNATLALNAVQLTDAGSYTVIISNSAGSVTSAVATLSVAPAGPSSWLSNVSIRTTLEAAQTVIVGFAVQGGSRNVLVRAVGPSLAAFGVTTTMADPRLELFRGQILASANEDWPAVMAPMFASAGAFGFSPGSRDAAIVQSLNGTFSIHTRGSGPGTVLVEVYDLGTGNTPRLVNISARNRVGTGDDILIAGFNLVGAGTKQLLIRAVGPGLGVFDIPGTLADPRLELFSSDGMSLAVNDNWAANLASTFTAVGAFDLPSGSLDAALVTSLSPGAFTVQVRGANGGTGEAIVEIYELP